VTQDIPWYSHIATNFYRDWGALNILSRIYGNKHVYKSSWWISVIKTANFLANILPCFKIGITN